MSDKNPIFDEKVQTIIDRHLQALMNELEEDGLKPVGVVAGVLNAGQTSVNWCVAVGDAPEDVVRGIARDIEASSRG